MNKKQSSILLVCLLLAAGALAYGLYTQRPFHARMGAYVTDLQNRSEAQRHNIMRAGNSFSEVIVMPGETFSLNGQAGPYTEDRGYLPERSIRGRRLVFTPGGGVCQVASTLFNTARLAELEIIERVPHTQAVRSVPPGLDATLAFGVSDLKFRNQHPFPVKMVTRVAHDQLLIEIWGKEVKHDRSHL